jgi:ketosteroid isomerase-like protein
MRTPYQIIDEHYAASSRRDIVGMMADVSDDVRWTEMAGFPCAGTYRSVPEIVHNVFEKLGSEWDNYQFQLDSLHDAGQTVIGVGRYLGIYRKTGKSLNCRVTHVWQVQDGKVVGFEQFVDTLLVALAMR